MYRQQRSMLVELELASYLERKEQLAELDKDEILASRKLLAAFLVGQKIYF